MWRTFDVRALIVGAPFNFLHLDGMSVIPGSVKPVATEQQQREMLLFSPEQRDLAVPLWAEGAINYFF